MGARTLPMRLVWRFLSLLLVAAPASAYVEVCGPHTNAYTTHGDDVTFFQYVVDLRPPKSDGIVEPPLDASAQAKYCLAAQEWGRRVHEMTHGQHRLGRVHFFNTDETFAQVHWYREVGVPRISWSNCFLGYGEFQMFDEVLGCVTNWQVENGQVVADGMFCTEPGFECVDQGAFGRFYCADEGVPVERPGTDWGHTLAHETSHWYYNANDDYYNSPSDALPAFQICMGDAQENQGLDTTSLMASRVRNRWCDDETHLPSRDFQGVNVANPSPNSAWSAALESVPDLMHSDTEYPDVDLIGLDPTECLFHFEVENDGLIVLDRSGSMDYLDPDTNQTALDQAVESALGLYNTTRPGAASGILGFNASVTTLQAYGEPQVTLDSLPVQPNGSTDLCEAIQEAVSTIRAAEPAAAHGLAVLLSDGLPTVNGCDTENDVLAAAWLACFSGIYPVSISTVAFGAADHELLSRVASMCGGQFTPAGAESADAQTPPHLIKVEMTRAAYDARFYTSLLAERRPFDQMEQTETFHVPAGAQHVEMVWLGDGHPACDLSLLQFELISPTAVPYDAAGNSPVGAAEIQYHSRSVRVDNPEPGTWTARISEPGPSFTCFPAAPWFGWVGELKHRRLEAEVVAAQAVAPRNTPITLTADLRFPYGDRATAITAEATVWRAGQATPVAMADDGLGADVLAMDGIYTGVFNPDGFVVDPGAHSVRVRLQAVEGTAVSVEPGHRPPGGALGLMPPARGTADVLVETSFVLQDCCDPSIMAPPDPLYPDCTGLLVCNAAVVPNLPATLVPGLSYSSLTVDLVGHNLGGEVQVGLGGEVLISNVSLSYDPLLDTTQVLFDATVDPRASEGAKDLVIRYGQQYFRSASATQVLGTPAGQVPVDGAAAPPLSVVQLPTGDLQLSWGPSCSASDVDFSVYEGSLGDFDGHTPVTCSTAGLPGHTFTPGAGNRYYLVVPQSADREGSYGLDGAGLERPPGFANCLGQATGACSGPPRESR